MPPTRCLLSLYAHFCPLSSRHIWQGFPIVLWFLRKNRFYKKVQRWYVKIKTILKDILSAMFQKDKNTHLSPANRIFEKWAGFVYRQIEKSILPDDINDCLWAVQRLTAQIYEQLMRGHVCVEIYLLLYIWCGKSGCIPCRMFASEKELCLSPLGSIR